MDEQGTLNAPSAAGPKPRVGSALWSNLAVITGLVGCLLGLLFPVARTIHDWGFAISLLAVGCCIVAAFRSSPSKWKSRLGLLLSIGGAAFWTSIVLWAGLSAARKSADERDRKNDLCAIGSAMMKYMEKHNDGAPENLAGLVTYGLTPAIATDTRYVYLKPAHLLDDPSVVLAYVPPKGPGEPTQALFIDGHVEPCVIVDVEPPKEQPNTVAADVQRKALALGHEILICESEILKPPGLKGGPSFPLAGKEPSHTVPK